LNSELPFNRISMTCIDTVCGTGGFTGPKPGDPDNNSTLAAVAAFGGIDVSWSYPTSNPAAVAHTLLYRNTSDNFAGATQIAVVAGNMFYDKLNDSVTYYYWIQIVSVNATVGAAIGPASATARPLSADLLTELAAKIDAGVLSAALRADINSVSIFGGQLSTEIYSRSQGQAYLADALAAAQDTGDQTLALVHSQDSAQSSRTDALATQMNIVASAVGHNTAAIISEQTARTSSVGALTTQLNSVVATTAQNTAAIITEQSARSTAIGSLTTQLNSVAATNSQNIAASIAQEQAARTTAETALANSITTVQSTLNGNVAAVQTNLQTSINAVAGQVGSVTSQLNTVNGQIAYGTTQIHDIGALYTTKVNVNGLVGGFGVYNDGTTIEAGFDVDTFWIGKTNANRRKPFVVTGGQVYMDSAFIADATITNAKIGNAQVDTLQVAGNAITAPAFQSYGGGSVATMYYTIPGDYGAPYQVFISVSAGIPVTTLMHLRVDGTIRWTELPSGGTLACKGIAVTLTAGIQHTIEVLTDVFSSASIFALATKR
jgi:hypothetical protein